MGREERETATTRESAALRERERERDGRERERERRIFIVMDCYFGTAGDVWSKALGAVLDLNGSCAKDNLAVLSHTSETKVTQGKSLPCFVLKTPKGVEQTTAAASASNAVVCIDGLGATFRTALVSNANLVTSKHMYPTRSNFLKSKVDAWIDVVSGSVKAFDTLVSPDKQKKVKKQQLAMLMKFAQEDLSKLFEDCEAHLLVNTFLASEHISCADVLLFALLSGLLTSVLGTSFWKKHPNLTRWLHTTHSFSCVKKAFGETLVFCEQEPEWNVAAPKDEKKKKAKEEKKEKKEKKAPAANSAAASLAGLASLAAAPKAEA